MDQTLLKRHRAKATARHDHRPEANGSRCANCGRTIASGTEAYHSTPCYCGSSDHASCNRPHM